ncbi:hypothetical protein [Cohnella luojiensis]|uniref:Uncharacterized protein n=1 Tax=Cohnella luojiensis TaxID=652876 RepID=A0A4Y8M7L6_9BACL|nr:hypothetical protein [Cohnella luojiensis]TFE30815.1 hypothetical protein E2980_03285 [Cohnella luojiensis]
MEIAIKRIDENTCMVTTLEAMTSAVANHLLANINYEIIKVDPRGYTLTTGSAFNIESQQHIHYGTIECRIVKGNLEGLVDDLKEKFALQDPLSNGDTWTLTF